MPPEVGVTIREESGVACLTALSAVVGTRRTWEDTTGRTSVFVMSFVAGSGALDAPTWPVGLDDPHGIGCCGLLAACRAAFPPATEAAGIDCLWRAAEFVCTAAETTIGFAGEGTPTRASG